MFALIVLVVGGCFNISRYIKLIVLECLADVDFFYILCYALQWFTIVTALKKGSTEQNLLKLSNKKISNPESHVP